MKNFLSTLTAAATLLGPVVALSQSVPQLINYQGQLLDGTGTPLTNGDYVIQVRLFTAEAGGTLIWGPQVFNGQSGAGFAPKVSVVQGRFNLVLGPQDTAAQNLAAVFAANPSVYLELQIGTGNPISPRQQILSSPFALNAANAINAVNATTAASAGSAANAANAANAADSAKLNGFDWSALFAGGNPQTGNMGVGTPPSEVKLDLGGRARLRQGSDASAGLWFSQNNGGDKGFLGMLDDNTFGLSLSSGPQPFTINATSGSIGVGSLSGGTLSANTIGVVPSGIRAVGFVSLTATGTGTIFFPVTTLSVSASHAVFSGDVTATGYTTSSDARLKEDIEPLLDPVQKLQALRGVSYTLKHDVGGLSASEPRRRVGVLAQDVQKVLPEAVRTAPNGYLSVEYGALTPVLIEAVKEQQKQIDELKAEIAKLKARQP